MRADPYEILKVLLERPLARMFPRLAIRKAFRIAKLFNEKLG